MGAEAKSYLQEHAIPQLFEGLMTGLIYTKPDDPLEFLENAIAQIRGNPNQELAWDMFISKELKDAQRQIRTDDNKENKADTKKKKVKPKDPKSSKEEDVDTGPVDNVKSTPEKPETPMVIQRVPSVLKAAEVARIPDVPIILFMGGPGGGKTRHAARVFNSLAEQGLVHICMPDVIRNALAKYKDKYAEWKDANDKYLRGELIPNHLALALVKAEMGRHPGASAFFLEGFPREARQVEDFEREVKTVNMAIILDYDERTLRSHMERRGLDMQIIEQRIKEFKSKTLPSAKYFDDQKLLHLIPGERDDQSIFERMRKLVLQAMETGVPVYNNQIPAEASSAREGTTTPANGEVPEVVHTDGALPNAKPPTAPGSAAAERRRKRTGSTTSLTSKSRSTSGSRRDSKPASKPGTGTNTPKQGGSRPPSAPKTASRPASKARNGSAGSQKEPAPAQTPVAELASEPAPTEAPPIETVSEQTAVITAAEVHPPPITPEKPSTRSFEASDIPKGLPNNAPVILIIGGPGSNKGLIAQRIAKKYEGFVLFSMGDLLRRKVQESRGDDLWERIGRKMDNGEAVPMKICRELLYRAIQEYGGTSWGYVIEGYPRTQSQAQDVELQLERVDLALLIDCTEQFCGENVKQRYEAGLANKTERPDDAPDLFKTRLELFKANGLPMLKYLDDKGRLRVVRGWEKQVDGDADDDRIFHDVTQLIDNTLFIEDNGSGKSLESSKNGSLNETPAT